jgi:hypothetical protein
MAVAFFGLVPPYGGMAERALVRAGAGCPVPGGADDLIAAAVLNPGGAARTTIMVESGLPPGRQSHPRGDRHVGPDRRAAGQPSCLCPAARPRRSRS